MNKKLPSFCEMIKFELKFCFGHCPLMMLGEILASILHGISFVLVVYFTQRFFDVIAKAVSKGLSFSDIFIWALYLGAVIVLNQILNGFENWLYDVLYNKLKGFSYLNLYKRIGEISSEEYENPEFLDELNKAKEGAAHFILPLFPIIGISTFYLAYFTGIGWYLYNTYPILLVSILIVFIPSFISQYLKVKMYSNLADESAIYKRQFEYFENCICGKEYLKETRLLSATGYFDKLYKETLEILNKKKWETNKRTTKIELVSRIITLFGYLLILVLFINALIRGKISIGMFAALYTSIEKMFSMMDEVVDTISSLTSNIGLMQNYIAFINKKEEVGVDMSISVKKEILLKDICYKYHNTKGNALENVNLTIKAGETIAIVGENGSGKTTLVKLISGLYKPTFGTIEYDGQDISNVKRTNIFNNISAVFQNFMMYKMNLRNNVNISQNYYGEENDESNDGNIIKTLNKVNFSFEQKKLKMDGLNTMLSREFDGTDLSGGQWQRIAIARGLYKNHQLIILDEPTASIDPIEEGRIFSMFSKIVEDKTAIIVTHRMGCAKIADKIIVMDNGKILEVGTHEELLAIKGKYKEMYEKQAQWYS